MTRSMQRWFFSVAVTGGLILGGCGGNDSSEDQAADSPTDQSDDSSDSGDSGDSGDGGTLTIEKDDGSFSSEFSASLPDDFPAGVFVPDDMVAPTVNRQDVGGVVEFTVLGLVEALPADVDADIQAAYDDEPSQADESGGVRTVTYEDVEGSFVKYTIQENDDGNSVVTMKVRLE